MSFKITSDDHVLYFADVGDETWGARCRHFFRPAPLFVQLLNVPNPANWTYFSTTNISKMSLSPKPRQGKFGILSSRH